MIILRFLKIAVPVIILCVLVFGLLKGPSNRDFTSAVEASDKVVVRSGGLCHRRPEQEEVLFVLEGSKEIQQLVDAIQVRKLGFALRCMCCGNPTFEFHRNGENIASVGFHHGKSLRWNGWSSDGMLTAKSSAEIISIFRRNGLSENQYMRPLRIRSEPEDRKANKLQHNRLPESS